MTLRLQCTCAMPTLLAVLHVHLQIGVLEILGNASMGRQAGARVAVILIKL